MGGAGVLGVLLADRWIDFDVNGGGLRGIDVTERAVHFVETGLYRIRVFARDEGVVLAGSRPDSVVNTSKQLYAGEFR